MERYWFESKTGKDRLDAARFLYQTSRMNTNLTYGQRAAFGNKYFYVSKEFLGVGKGNPIYDVVYEEYMEKVENDPYEPGDPKVY